MNAVLISTTAPCSSQTKNAFLQRVDQSSAPAGLMVAQPRQLDIGAHPGQQLRGGEWLDEVVVGAGLQPFDRGFLPGARGQQQDGYGGGSRVRSAAPRPVGDRPFRAS